MDWLSRAIFLVGLITLTSSDTVEPSTETVEPSSEPSLAHSVNTFSYQLLLNTLNENEHQNVVLGSASVAGLLGMTLLGSIGDTYDELATILGFSQDILQNRKNHEQLGSLLQSLSENGTTPTAVYSDAIFVDARAHVRPVYREFLQRVYSGDAIETDFSNSTLAKMFINDWVRNQTQGKIEEFLQMPLSKDTRAVLLSAHYFNGQWENPFSPEFTRKMVFHKPEGEVMADLMLTYGKFKYIFSEKHGCHMVALPYNDSKTTMYALSPRLPKKMNLTTLLDNLDWTTIDNLTTLMKNESTVIRFPKMTLKTSVDLKGPLRSAGITSVFEAGKANFALMIEGKVNKNKTDELIIRLRNGDDYDGLKEQLAKLPNPGIHIDSVMHDVHITINEFGTEAVAVTAGFLARSTNSFHADSPFLFFIRNEETGLVTFSAIINDPTILA